jgi:glycosyltransferase involved in cell wall biosynthesis
LNVLLITFSFPPAGGVGVLRALSLAKYLPENDIRLDVLTARNAPAVGKDLSLLQQVPASVTVHKAWTLDLPFAMRKALKKAVAGNGAKAEVSAANSARSARSNFLKQTVGDMLLPDPQVGWLPFAFPAARRIIRNRKIDLVLITVPPFSTVLLVSKLRKAFPALPIVLDFRDEWLTTTINLVSFNKNEKARQIAQQAEAEAVRDATAVVAVTEAARREIRSRYPVEAEEKFLCVPNGYDLAPRTAESGDTAATASPTNPNEKIVLTYIGSVYGSTDPTTFIEAVSGLPEPIRARLHVRFIGHIETPAYREALLSLGETIELCGFVPQAKALQAIQHTTYLLLITHDRINVAAKLYDYLGGGKPILAAVHPDGDVRRLLEETRTGWWADVDDVAAIRQLLVEAVERGPEVGEAFQPEAERIASYHRRPLTRRYAGLLKKLAPKAQVKHSLQ